MRAFPVSITNHTRLLGQGDRLPTPRPTAALVQVPHTPLQLHRVSHACPVGYCLGRGWGSRLHGLDGPASCVNLRGSQWKRKFRVLASDSGGPAFMILGAPPDPNTISPDLPPLGTLFSPTHIPTSLLEG